MPLWTRNNSGGNSYNQAGNQGYGNTGRNSAKPMFGLGFGNRGSTRQNGSYANRQTQNPSKYQQALGNQQQHNQQPMHPPQQQFSQQPMQPFQQQFGQQPMQPLQQQFGQQPMQPPQQQFGQQPMQPFQQQFGQQPMQPLQQQFGQQPMQPLQQQFGQQPMQPLQQQFGQQPMQPLQPAPQNLNKPTGMPQNINMPSTPNNLAGKGLLESINRDLPDGVAYHPVDMKNLPSQIGSLTRPIAPQPDPVPPRVPEPLTNELPKPQLPEHEQTAFNFIEKIIQNEHNGSRYYNHLATLSLTSEQREIISDIYTDCSKQKNIFTELYIGKSANPFKPIDVEINTDITFRNGILFAIKEESKTLRELGEYTEKNNDRTVSSLLTSRIYRKISDLSYLHYIISTL